jgi:hypothetical protein
VLPKRGSLGVAFFEGATGSPHTGIIDAVAFRLGRKNADQMDLRIVKLKGGKAGVSGAEIAVRKSAAWHRGQGCARQVRSDPEPSIQVRHRADVVEYRIEQHVAIGPPARGGKLLQHKAGG